MQKFDWILDGDHVFGAKRVHAIDHRGQRCRFSRAGDSRDQHESTRLVAYLLDDLGQIQLFKDANLGGNNAQHQSDVAALLKDVHAESSESGDSVRHIEFRGLFELLLLPVRHHAERHAQHVFGGNARLLAQRSKFTVDSNVREVADLQVQVGGLTIHCYPEQIIDIHRLSLIHGAGTLEARLVVWPAMAPDTLRTFAV